MKLFDRSTSRLAAGPTLLLSADPGPDLLDAARRYDPGLRQWNLLGRLVFANGVLLFGPVTLTPAIARAAGLPAGAGVAWYARAALQRHYQRRSLEAKAEDGEKLVRGLAARLRGTTHPARLQPKLSLAAAVYSDRALPAGQVIDALRPYAGDLKVHDEEQDRYSLSGKGAPWLAAYWGPRWYLPTEAPAALGPVRPGKLHRWDLYSGVHAADASRELCLSVGGAALALAGQSGGVAVDMLGFLIGSADDLLLR